MKKEDLIKKWLDHNLSQEEMKAFEQTDAFTSFEQLDWAAKQCKAPSYNTEKQFNKLKKLTPTAQAKVSWKRYVIGIAAALLLGFFITTSIPSGNIQYQTLAKNQKTVSLPDASEVLLNASSTISFNEGNWDRSRAIELEGEAFFKVAKGQTFSVKSDLGTVEVLGTQFNVYNRGDFFLVQCYEGTVKVIYNNNPHILHIGDAFSSTEGKVSFERLTDAPSWTNEKSDFQSVPFSVVANELEIQYGLTVSYPPNLTMSKYTGSFSHKNLDLALQAITIPFNLEYSIKGSTVTLKARP